MAYPYYLKDSNMFFSAKETAFRTNAHGKDTANQAADTFYAFPISIQDGWTHIWERKKFSKHKDVGSKFITQINMDGYEDIILTVSGPVLNHSLFMFFGTDVCATTDNSPSAGYYTHRCNSDDTYPAEPPSFQILRKIENGVGAQDIWNLFVGCIVTNYEESNGTDGIITGKYTIHCAKVIDGVALTTEPSRMNKDYFNIEYAVMTWTKAAAGYNGQLKSYTLKLTTDKSLWKGATESYPSVKLSANSIEFTLDFKFLTFVKSTYEDSQDDPHSDHDKDLTLRVSRNATNDYIQYSFVKLFQKFMEIEFDNILLENHHICKNPHETNNQWNITEVNDLDDDRYET